jgi:hypothetical protein
MSYEMRPDASRLGSEWIGVNSLLVTGKCLGRKPGTAYLITIGMELQQAFTG